jgi:hypothetical protein
LVNTDRRYITPQEFAQIFRITRRSVYRNLNKLPYTQIGGKKGPIRIDMYEYMKQNSIIPGGDEDTSQH